MSTPPPTSPAATPDPVSGPGTPEPAWRGVGAARGVIAAHIAAVSLVQSTWMAIAFITPILARKRFDANPWETLLITATPTIFFSLSIFWNDFFTRRSLGQYLRTYWLWAGLPLVLVAFATEYWMLLVPHLLTCVGGAGYHPAAGELLRSLYPERIRGRVYSIIWGASMVVGAGLGYLIGRWMDHDPDAFRIIFPAIAALQLGGCGLFVRLARRTGHTGRRLVDTSEDLRSRWRRIAEPIGHMRSILKSDPVFARYEASFMTYGIGWMICYALLPIMVTDRLGLDYEAIAGSTHAAYFLAATAMIVPAGVLMDRLGAVRCTGLSFLLLTLYPIGLIASWNVDWLLASSIVYGIAHSGTSMGWMLGPVALAPSKEKVPQYVAIHATLVGIRGKVFQFAGVGLYALTGSFTVPFVVAAVAFAWSALQMKQLERRMRGARKAG